jgi:hypothetical protein
VKSLFTRAHSVIAIAGLTIAMSACQERLETGSACPILCPGQQPTIRDTTFFAVVLDSAITAFPVQGNEPHLFIASMGDTMETVGVVRFDSLPTIFRYTPTAEDSLIYAVDSANIFIVPVAGDTLGSPVTIEVYTVDLGGPDDANPDLAASAFTPDRLIGSRTIPADSLRDSVVVMIDNNAVLSVIQAQQQDTAARGLRLGIKVNAGSDGKNFFRMMSAENGLSQPRLRFRPHFDTAIGFVEVSPRSDVPENIFIRIPMADYLVVVRAPDAAPSDVLRVGGIPGSRVYMEFDIPQFLIDSTDIVRATLELTQRPNLRAPQAMDSVTVREFRIVASREVTDLDRRLLFTERFRILDTLALIAPDSGRRQFEIIDLVQSWAGTTAERTPRALALNVPTEGTMPKLIDFFSNEAPETVRPRLRIFYLPRAEGGLP